jgi:glycine C-acetyltransferase
MQLLASEADRLRDAGLYKREILFSPGGGMVAGGMAVGHEADGMSVVNFTTHDYLGLSRDPQVQHAAKRAMDELGTGISSQRVMCGTLPIHKELEQTVAHFLGVDDAIIFGSCYQANVGLFSPLLGRRDCIISDEYIHPSLADGARLAGSRLVTYRNNDPEDLEEKLKRSRWARFRAIATNGVFPFDGRLAELSDICYLAEKYEALVVVDDCLGIGVLGEHGRGTSEFMKVADRVDLVTGTFSKALGGASGGFIAGRKVLVDWLRQKSSPYLFSAALPPAMAGAALRVVQILEDGGANLPGLRDRINTLWHGLLEKGFRVLGGDHPLIAVHAGNFSTLQSMVNELYEDGIYVHGLCYPVVPEGEARIRVLLSALHSEEHLHRAIAAFEKAGRAAGVIE